MNTEDSPSVEGLMKLADDYAHVYAFVEDNTMPRLRAAVESYARRLASPAATVQEGEKVEKFWLWKNFVDGRPEYWAFDNPYPTRMDCGDPQTLGEPCGYAIFKESRNGRPDMPEEKVIAAIRRVKGAAALRSSEATRGDFDMRHEPGEAHPQGCCRSHPHENMDEECQRKTEEARTAAALRSDPALAALCGRLRALEQDHEPEGWPAVQMRDISALLDALGAEAEATRVGEQSGVAEGGS